MSIGLADSIRTARAQVLVNAIDVGTPVSTLTLYTAPQPAKGAAISTQTVLAVLDFGNPSGTVSNGVITFTLNNDPIADADGLIAWGRVKDGDGGFVMDMSATDNAGSGPIKLNSLQVYAGGQVQVTSAVLTEGDG